MSTVVYDRRWAQYSYKIKKTIQIRFFYEDDPETLGEIEWIQDSNVAVLKNIDLERSYRLSISGNIDTLIAVQDFTYEGVKYDEPVPPYSKSFDSRQDHLLRKDNHNALQKQFILRHENVGKRSDYTRIYFDYYYMDVFHEQKENVNTPENPLGENRFQSPPKTNCIKCNRPLKSS